MKINKTFILFVLISGLLISCNKINDVSSNDESSDSSVSSLEPTSSEESQSEEFIESSSGEEESSSNKEESEDKEESSSSEESEITVSGNNPDGSPRISGPNNTPIVISDDYHNYDTSESLPDGFSLIYGNDKYENPSYSKFEHNGDNPSVNGLKMDYYDKNHNGRSYIGIQSPNIVNVTKIEFRINVSTVHGTQDIGVKKNKPVFTIYGFNSSWEHIYTKEYYGEKQDDTSLPYINIFTNTNPKFYIENSDVSYFEFRLNQRPFKNGQGYNFNINQLTLKGYNY